MKAVVIGRNYTSLLGMIRAAGEAGCEVVVIKNVKHLNNNFRSKAWRKFAIEAKSKYVIKHMFMIEPDRENLIKMLKKEFASEKEKVILLPTDDYAASTIDMYQEELKDKFLFPHVNNKQGEVVKLMDKYLQKELAQKAGLKVVQGWKINIENGKYEIPEDIIYPCFTKPEVSFLANKLYMKKCDSREELVTFLDGLAFKKDCPILVEQYIEIEKEYGVLGYNDTERTVIPSLVDKVIIGSGIHKGVTMIGDIHPMERCPDLADKLKKFLHSTNFVGLIDIDLYESKGEIYFNELNLRLGAFGYGAMCAGINLPQMLIETLQGHDFPNVKTEMDKTIRCISEKVCLEDFADGYVDYRTYKERMRSAEYTFIKSKVDPKPYRYFKLDEMKRRVKFIIKRFK